MFSSSRRRSGAISVRCALALASAALCLTSCGRRDTAALARVGIPAFEDLSPHHTQIWLTQALPDALASMLNATEGVYAYRRDSRRTPEASGSRQVLLGTVEQVGSTIRLTAQWRDESTQRTLKEISAEGPLEQGVLPVAASLARQLKEGAGSYETANERAFRAYGEGLSARDTGTAVQKFSEAVTADPRYSAAYLAWAHLLLGRGDRSGAQSVLQRASGAAGMNPAGSARLELTAAVLSGDLGKRYEALQRLTAALPRDPDAHLELAAVDLQRRDLAGAVAEYRRVLAFEPAHPAALNGLGYALAYGGDLAGARTALETARRYYPADPNVLDSLGEVHYLRASFAEAERYFHDSYRQDPNFQGGVSLYKAAWAEWRAGKATDAESTMQRFLAAREAQRDMLVPLRRALWLHERGKAAEGERVLSELSADASAPDELKAVATAQQAIWGLLAGDRDRAKVLGQRAVPLARLPLSQSLLRVLAFLMQPSASVPEWQTRAQQAFGQPGQELFRARALGYALLLDRHWPEAALQWRALAAQQDPGNSVRPSVLASWALAEAGQTEAARQAAALVALPVLDDDLVMESLLFPRDMELRRKLGLAAKEPG